MLENCGIHLVLEGVERSVPMHLCSRFYRDPCRVADDTEEDRTDDERVGSKGTCEEKQAGRPEVSPGIEDGGRRGDPQKVGAGGDPEGERGPPRRAQGERSHPTDARKEDEEGRGGPDEPAKTPQGRKPSGWQGKPVKQAKKHDARPRSPAQPLVGGGKGGRSR